MKWPPVWQRHRYVVAQGHPLPLSGFLSFCESKLLITYSVESVWNVMAHAQKPYFVLRRNGRVHFNRRGRQFSRLLAAEVCASAVVMLDTPRSEVMWEYWLPTPFVSFPFTYLSLHHRVPSSFKRTLLTEVPNTLKYVSAASAMFPLTQFK